MSVNNTSEKKSVPIIVVGDVAIDWLAAKWSYGSDTGGPVEEWHRHGQVQMLAMMSGAWMIENFLLRLGPDDKNLHTYFCYQRPAPIGVNDGAKYGPPRRTANPQDYLHTFTELELFDRIDDAIACVPTMRQEPSIANHVARLDAALSHREPCDALCATSQRPQATACNVHSCPVRGPASSGHKVYRFSAQPQYFGPAAEKSTSPGKGDVADKECGIGEKPAAEKSTSPGKGPNDLRSRTATERFSADNPPWTAAWNQVHVVAIYNGVQRVFRQTEDCWKQLLPEPKDGQKLPYIVMFHRPRYPLSDSADALWARLTDKSYSVRTTIVVTADSLRRQGINIGKSLSWERTVLDFLTALSSHAALKQLSRVSHLVVRFGFTGAIHCHTSDGSRPRVTLVYDPGLIEGEYRDHKRLGHMSGMSTLMTASIARSLADELGQKEFDVDDLRYSRAVQRGVHSGLLAGRTLFCQGFGQRGPTDAPPLTVLALEKEDRWNDQLPYWNDADLKRSPLAMKDLVPDDISENWKLLNLIDDNKAEGVAGKIAREGIDAAFSAPAAQQFPIAAFGDLRVVDRHEIEGFRSIRNLLQDHRDRQAKTPLSIAVFGPPGSGKSFGVREIVKSIQGPDDAVRFITYNLAQFVHPNELSQALLPIRDAALDNELAVVFFDEFDTRLDGKELGWLKHFLPVMQDGEFKHGEGTLKVGGPVFVFAGGTSHTYEDFCKNKDDRDFKLVKGPDFVSRLRGFVNIRGIDKLDPEGPVYMIRRAIFLRSILWHNYRCLFTGDKENASTLQIDSQVLRALLKTDKYSHGARSLQAVLEMSRLANAARFDASRLPSEAQLKMHIEDVDYFMELLRAPLPEHGGWIDCRDSNSG